MKLVRSSGVGAFDRSAQSAIESMENRRNFKTR